MTTAPDPFDRRARQLHAESLAHVSPDVLARLRRARREAAAASSTARSRRLPSWLAGGAVAAAVVLAVALRPQPAPLPPDAGSATTVAVADELAGPLQEDPGFYLWLASADVASLALE